jgi:hypothetical protein
MLCYVGCRHYGEVPKAGRGVRRKKTPAIVTGMKAVVKEELSLPQFTRILTDSGLYDDGGTKKVKLKVCCTSPLMLLTH